jgi:hypothetical protein
VGGSCEHGNKLLFIELHHPQWTIQILRKTNKLLIFHGSIYMSYYRIIQESVYDQLKHSAKEVSISTSVTTCQDLPSDETVADGKPRPASLFSSEVGHLEF